LSLAPVHFKVTANHAESKVTAWHPMCATRSARNDIREGGDILKVATMDDNNDYFSKKSCIGADIIESYIT
jgi:hypothetical protein